MAANQTLTKGEAQKVQWLLAAAGYYKDALDGIIGAKSQAGIDKVLTNHPSLVKKLFNPEPSAKRKAVAAAQLILHFAGHTVGEIDGYWGNLTEGAFLEWSHKKVFGEGLDLYPERVTSHTKGNFPAQRNFDIFYGLPGPDIESKLVFIDLPYTMKLDWNHAQTVNRMRVHEKCAASAIQALTNVLKSYGKERISILGLDRFAGSYNHRVMRGGTSWSTHAYGAAIDFYAAPNGLTTRCPQALFCKEAYVPFFDIWEDAGWTSLGRAIGRDWMHVQAGSVT